MKKLLFAIPLVVPFYSHSTMELEIYEERL